MHKISFLILYILLFAISCFSQLQTFTTKEGNKFQLELKTSKKTIMIGEPLAITLKLQNLSEESLSSKIDLSYKDSEYLPRCSVSIIDNNGKTVFQTNDSLIKNDCPLQNSFKNFVLPTSKNFQVGVTYRINVYVTLFVSTPKIRYSTLTQANLTTNFAISTPDYNKIGVLIDSLGKTLLDENSFTASSGDYPARLALEMLNNINDERIIPYLAQALDVYSSLSRPSTLEELKNSGSFSTKKMVYNDVPQVLEKFNDYPAIEAFEKSMRSNNAFVRENVSSVLAKSENPLLANILIKFWNDENRNVRSQVVRALGKINTEESTDILREMLKDEDDFIRKNVQSILITRVQK